jgi:hypothetical protein
MKKETIIAIVLGISLGIVVAGFLIFTSQKNDKPKVIPVAVGSRITPTVVKQAIVNEGFEITQPEQNSITNGKKITITGKAAKESLIIMQSATQNIVFRNKAETFSQEITLTTGENVFNISVYPKDSKSQVMERQLIVYSLEE